MKLSIHGLLLAATLILSACGGGGGGGCDAQLIGGGAVNCGSSGTGGGGTTFPNDPGSFFAVTPLGELNRVDWSADNSQMNYSVLTSAPGNLRDATTRSVLLSYDSIDKSYTSPFKGKNIKFDNTLMVGMVSELIGTSQIPVDYPMVGMSNLNANFTQIQGFYNVIMVHSCTGTPLLCTAEPATLRINAIGTWNLCARGDLSDATPCTSQTFAPMSQASSYNGTFSLGSHNRLDLHYGGNKVGEFLFSERHSKMMVAAQFANFPSLSVNGMMVGVEKASIGSFGQLNGTWLFTSSVDSGNSYFTGTNTMSINFDDPATNPVCSIDIDKPWAGFSTLCHPPGNISAVYALTGPSGLSISTRTSGTTSFSVGIKKP